MTMATHQWSAMSRRRPPKSAAYVDPDDTVSVASDDDRTITDIANDDKGDEPVTVPSPSKKCAITYIINDDDDDKHASMSGVIESYLGTSAAKPILIDNEDDGDSNAAAATALVSRVCRLQPHIKTEPQDDTGVSNGKIKKEFDPVADAKQSSVLYGAQVDGLPLMSLMPLMPPKSPKEKDKPEQAQAGEKEPDEPAAAAQEQPSPQEEPAPDLPKNLFGDIDMDGIDLDAVLQNSMNEQGLFSMDSVNMADDVGNMGDMGDTCSMQALQDLPLPTTDSPPLPSCESQLAALYEKVLENLIAGPVKENDALPVAATDATTNKSTLRGRTTSVEGDATTLVGTPEPDDKAKDPALDSNKASPMEAPDFEALFGVKDKASVPDKGTAPDKDSVAFKATPGSAAAETSSRNGTSIAASTGKPTATKEKTTKKEGPVIEGMSKDKPVDASVVTAAEKAGAEGKGNEQGHATKATAAQDAPLDKPEDVEATQRTSVPNNSSKSIHTTVDNGNDTNGEKGKNADEGKDSAPKIPLVPDVNTGPSTPASVPVPSKKADNTPAADETNKESNNSTAPVAGMEQDMDPIVDAGPSVHAIAPEVAPTPPTQPGISPEEAVATQLASASGLEPELAPLQEQHPPEAPAEPEESLFADLPQEPGGAPLGDDQQDPVPMDIDPAANAGADPYNEESVFVDPHPEVEQEDLELDIEDVENGISLEGPGYAWKDIDTIPQGRAIRILEESVASGIELGRKVIASLSKGDPDTRIHSTRWKKEFARICEENDNFQVLVGVSGITGAGKTTLINALIDTHELLPSGSHGAATATVCRVHQAKEPDAPPFRAVVTFKTKQGMREWLEPLLGDVADYHAWKDAQDEKARNKKAKKGWGDDSDDSDFDEDDSDSDSESEEDDDEDDEDFVPDNGTAQQRKEHEQKKKHREEKQKAKAAKREEKDKKRREKEAKKAAEEGEGDDEPFDKQAMADKLRSVEGIFRRNIDHLRGWTVKGLLNKDLFPIVKLVGKTKTIVSDGHEAFSDAIKPFLDSTPIPDGYDYDAFDGNENGEWVEEEEDDDEDEEEGDDQVQEEEEEGEEEEEEEGDGDNGQEDGDDNDDKEEEIVCNEDRVMWPIVDHVDIYLKHAPLLANGVVLADLPGLADANEDRAAIAKACFDRLHITMVVAPAIRAGDDATAAGLLSDNEEVHLRLTNRLNKRSFCFVASKTDDLCNWETYLEKTINPEQGSLLHHVVKAHAELEKQLGIVDDALRKADDDIEEQLKEREIEKASVADDSAEKWRLLGMEIVEMKEWHAQISRRRRDLEGWLQYYHGLLAFRTFEFRNNTVSKKVQATFLRKTAAAREKSEALMAKVAQRKERAKKAAEARQAEASADVSADVPAGPPPKVADAPVADAAPDNAKSQEIPEPIDVLLVSADAYWQIRKDDNRRRGKYLKEGFPTASFTGVPAARAWIRAATIPIRRTHATTLLMRLSVLLHELKTGFGEAPAPMTASISSRAEDVDMDRGANEPSPDPLPMPVQAAQVVDNSAEAVREILVQFKEVLAGNLGNSANRLEVQANGCNPMAEAAFNQPAMAPVQTGTGKGDKDGAAVKSRKPQFRPSCRYDILKGVETWQYRNMMKDGAPRGATTRKTPNKGKGGKRSAEPEMYATTWLKGVKGNHVRMPWATHAAIIRRRGGPYVSTGKIPGAYMWMRNMTRLVLADVVGYWEMSLHGRLPNEVEVARGLLMDAWGRAVSHLRARLPPYFSGEKRARLRQHLSAILAIRDCCVDAAQRAMEGIAEQSKGVAVLVEGILDKGWKKVFEQALNMSGKGVFKSRQSLLESFARENTQPLVKKAMLSMDSEYRSNVKKFRETLDEIREDGLVQVERQVNAIMQLVAGEGNAALANRAPLDERAARIQSIIVKWDGVWKSPDASTKMDVDIDVDADVNSAHRNGREGNSGVSGIDGGSTAMPTEYIPAPIDLTPLETLLPDLEEFKEDDNTEEEEDGEWALDKELMIVPDSKPKRGAKRKAGDDGGKGKAPAKKRKPAAPKKPAAKGTMRGGRGGGRGGGKAASKAGGGKSSRGGKGGGRGGRGGRGRGKT